MMVIWEHSVLILQLFCYPKLLKNLKNILSVFIIYHNIKNFSSEDFKETIPFFIEENQTDISRASIIL